MKYAWRITRISEEPEEPLKEFSMAVVGPLASFVLAGVFLVISFLLHSLSAPLSASAGYLALINVALGIFNLLPGFPMDGGRVAGIICRTDILKVLQLRSELGV